MKANYDFQPCHKHNVQLSAISFIHLKTFSMTQAKTDNSLSHITPRLPIAAGQHYHTAVRPEAQGDGGSSFDQYSSTSDAAVASKEKGWVGGR